MACRRLLLLFAVSFGVSASTACSSSTDTAVELTITHFALATAITDFSITVVGDNTTQSDWNVTLGGRPLADAERIVYRPAITSGPLRISVAAFDAAHALVACTDPVNVTVSPKQRSTVTLVLGPCGEAPSDMADMADMAVVDATTQNDAASVDASGPKLCPTDAILCDDFESGNFTTHWTAVDSDPPSSVTLDSTRFYEGGHSAHVHAAGPTSGTLYVRSMLRANLGLPPPIYARVFIYGVNSNLNGDRDLLLFRENSGNGVVLALFSGALQIYGAVAAPSNAPGTVSSTSLKSGVWNCVEWEIDAVAQGQSGGAFHAWIENVAIPALDSTPVVLAPLNTLNVGISTTMSPGQTIDLWYDGVAVANHRLGCP